MLTSAGTIFSQTAPTAVNDTVGVCIENEITTNVLWNDEDPDFGAVITIDEIVVDPSSDLIDVSFDEWGNITIYAEPGFTGSDVLLYQVCDEDGQCAIGTLVIKVLPENQCVWPGDANNDSIANYVDLLPIGVFFGLSGPERYDVVAGWEPEYGEEWEVEDEWMYEIAPDPKFADCNGDGIINALDTVPIAIYYGLTHGDVEIDSAIGGPSDAEFSVVFLGDSMTAGSEVVIPLILGTEEIPATNVYGIAFQLDYDESLIVPGSIKVMFNSGWLGTPGSDLLSFAYNDTLNGNLEISVTRTNQVARSGYGNIGEVHFVMEDNVAGRTNGEFSATVHLCVNAPYTINKFGAPIPVNRLCDSVTIFEVQTSIDELIPAQFNIYPNPADDYINIKNSSQHAHGIWELANIYGQIILKKETASDITTLETPKLPSGTYALTYKTDNSTFTETIIIQH